MSSAVSWSVKGASTETISFFLSTMWIPLSSITTCCAQRMIWRKRLHLGSMPIGAIFGLSQWDSPDVGKDLLTGDAGHRCETSRSSRDRV